MWRSLASYIKCALSTILLTLSIAAWASPTITVASPKAGTVGAPTYFDATASTSTCAAGISAVRIYTAPGVAAFTTNSPHLETFLKLKPGSYNTVIQAWDNCGASSKFPITISVTAAAGVHVFLPAAGSNNTPVHFAASAENPACAAGISAVRIYPAPGVNAFTSSGSTLDAFVNLLPGTYNAVAQAWDNCGHVFKTALTIKNNGGSPGKFLYIADNGLKNIARYQLNAGTLTNANGANNAPPVAGLPSEPNSIAVDPPGNLAYAGLADGRVAIFDINRATGGLFRKGLIAAPGTGPASVTVDSSGNFLLAAEGGSQDVTSYRVNRSDGTLTKIGTVSAGVDPSSIVTDFSGRFVYASTFKSDDISAYSLNSETGKLTPIAGSPFLSGSQPVALGTTNKVLYTLNNSGGTASGYTINSSTGSLSQVPGSPFVEGECCGTPNMLALDPFHDLLFYSAIGFTFGTDNIASEIIQSNGGINGGGGSTGGVFDPTSIALDPSYQFIYVSQVNGKSGQPQILSIKYSSTNGSGSIFSGPILRPGAEPIQLAVSR
jgi:6-phosphogluconolactonase (cycloisomerase 2 family)